MPYKDPEKAKESWRRYREAHKDKAKTYRTKYYQDNKDKLRSYGHEYVPKRAEKRRREGIPVRRVGIDKERRRDLELKRLYGIGIEEKRQMYVDQNGICPVCGKPLPPDFNEACVDHDHETGQVRELLHRRCNMLVGVEENQPGVYNRLLEYMEKYATTKREESESCISEYKD